VEKHCDGRTFLPPGAKSSLLNTGARDSHRANYINYYNVSIMIIVR